MQDPQCRCNRPTIGETQAVAPLRLHHGSADPRLLPSLLFFSSFSFIFSFSFLPSLDENQLWEGLDFFCVIFLLYVRCHCPNGCCKTHLLQLIRIEVKFLLKLKLKLLFIIGSKLKGYGVISHLKKKKKKEKEDLGVCQPARHHHNFLVIYIV